MVMKKCIICGKEFDAKGRALCCSDECKKINRRAKVNARVKKCIKNGYDNNKWNKENKEGVAKANKKWNDNNKERRAELNKEWNDNNKERRAELNKKWNENNKERRKSHNENINGEKLEKQRAYCREYGGYFDNNEWHSDEERKEKVVSKEELQEKIKSKWGALMK